MESGQVLLQLNDICKTFGGTRALHKVNLAARRGEVHALIGENGAGKSTLMKVLSGAYQADSGSIEMRGRPCVIDSPLSGREHGIAMIYQELTLAPHLTVEENITLGMEKTTLGFVRHQRGKIREALELLQHADIPLKAPVRTLGIGIQQVVEIARALISNAEIIIMDEPTSSLSAADTRALFEAIRRLREKGIAIIYISHFLEEVTEIADVYTVLRDGETVGSGEMTQTTIPRIIQMMIGRELKDMFPRIDHCRGELLMRVEGLDGSPLPRGVSLELHRGEILGIAGLVGAGRTETLRRIFGLDSSQNGSLRVLEGEILPLSDMTPRRALKIGLNFLSENRKEEGLATSRDVAFNVTLSGLPRYAGLGGWGLLNLRREKEAVGGWIEKVNIKCRGPRQTVRDLSGGNQQKVAIARILEENSDVILLDEPTRGIDVGSKVEIYRLVGRLAAQGKGIVFVSSYLPELLGICDSLAVMHRGAISPIKPVSGWTDQEIMRVATSGN